MEVKCKKCGSANVKVTGNKRGRYVGKCADCKHWGDYGKKVDEKEGSGKKTGDGETGTAQKKSSPPRTNRNNQRTGKGKQAGSGPKPARGDQGNIPARKSEFPATLRKGLREFFSV